MNPRRSLSEAYAGTEADLGSQRRRRLAASFRFDEHSENLLRLQHEQPETFASLSPTTRMSAGAYQVAKQAYEELMKDESK